MPEIVKAYCNRCGGEKDHTLLAQRKQHWDEGDGAVDGTETYEMIECRGCHSIHFRTISYCSECIEPDGSLTRYETYYPSIQFRQLPSWVSQVFVVVDFGKSTFVDILSEVYLALNANAPSLAAMGIRALIEWAALDKVGDRGSFINNLDAMYEDGHIARRQKETLMEVLDLGSAAIHRGYIPKMRDVVLALSIVENMLEMLYAVPNRTSFKDNTPCRKKPE